MLELVFALFSFVARSFRIAGTPATFDPAPQLPLGDS
jgi:hypothetical protein